MYKKTLLSLAVASSMTLTGCIGTESGDDEPSGNNPNAAGLTWPIFNPAAGALPIPNDLIFDSEQGDGTFGVSDTSPPVTTALNELSGASTVAPAVIQTNGQIDSDTVIYGQTVFLIELTYASGDPLQGLSNQESPQPIGVATARADVESLDGKSAIRILPIDPLKPRTRYVAVITNEVLDVNGDPIVQSPTYKYLTNPENEAPPALAPVVSLINSFWETVAVGFFDAAINPVRAGLSLSPLTADNIAMSYSFTTSNDEKVLRYIAEPGAWVSDSITTALRVGATKKLTGAALFFGGSKLSVEDWDLNDDDVVDAADFDRIDLSTAPPSVVTPGEITPGDFLIGGNATFGYDDLLVAANEIEDGFPATFPGSSPTLNDLFDPGSETPFCVDLTGSAAIDCVGVALASLNIADLPTPIAGLNRTAGDITFDVESTNGVGLISAIAAQIPGSDGVLAVSGSITLPTYIGTTATGALTQSWVADDQLAADITAPLGVTLPQSDPTVSKAVNYIFPFPKEQGTVDVPMLTVYPADGDAKGLVIFQHGIRQDRSGALTIGTSLAANGYVVVAIDHPLHGVNPSSVAERTELATALLVGAGLSQSNVTDFGLATALVEGASAFDTALAASPFDGAFDANTRTSLVNTVENAGSSIPGLAPGTNPRHFNLFADGNNQPQPMNFDPANAAGISGSGSFFINLQNFLNYRDNNRQSVVDQMNLRASLTDGTLVIPNPTAGPDISVATDTPVFFAGHSLGTLTGTPYVGAVNSNQIASTIFTPGGPIPSSSNDIIAASMLTPGGGVVRLGENSPAFAPVILGGLQKAAGLAQGDAALETFFNVGQAALDTADPINFVDDISGAGTPTLLSIVIGDQVIPNAADADVWGPENGALMATIGNINIDSFPAPLAGSFPLAIGGSIVRQDYTDADYAGVNHGSPVDPISSPSAFIQISADTNAFFDAELP